MKLIRFIDDHLEEYLLIGSFFVTVTVIKLEGPPLLEHFAFVNRFSGARTLARSFVVSHLLIMY